MSYFEDFSLDSKIYIFTDITGRLKCHIYIKLTKTAKYNERFRSSGWKLHEIDF